MGNDSLPAQFRANPRPFISALIFLLAGALVGDTLWLALLPTGLYLGIHLIEGETVTPMLLAKRFTLKVLVPMSLVFWFWMWGVPGALLSCQCWQ
jgi:predicted PurR-regulated permease PerM